jgi:murein hydrolase activator
MGLSRVMRRMGRDGVGKVMERNGVMRRAGMCLVLLLVLPQLPYPPYLPYAPEPLLAQQSGTAATLSRRVAERIDALRREAERLAAQSRTLVGDLQRLEVERDLQAEQVKLADAALVDAAAAQQQAAERLAALEQQRLSQLPDMKQRLVDLYKRGVGGYARVLAGANNMRDLARATRAVASLSAINQQKIDEHRRLIEQLRREQVTLAEQTRALQARQAEAMQARAAAQRAVAARAALVAQIDARRDLTAQLTGELQVASERLQQEVADLAAGRAGEPVTVPLAPFRGALDWPAPGRMTGSFGQTTNRLGGSAVRNGIEIGAPEGAAVRAVHGGTVALADDFTGFGKLVIVDHGANYYSLYGYLAATTVARGDRIEGGAELGRVGFAPAGPPALYFEIRVDGRSVDPVQWLKPR